MNRIKGNHIARSISVLVGGAASAHAITALALPVLSRLYTPSDFSSLAVFNAIFVTITVAACLRYDIAIPIPEKDEDAVNLVSLSLLLAACVGLLLCVPALGFPDVIAGALKHPEIGPYLWLLPVGVFLSAGASVMQNWYVRQKGFAKIATSRIAQSAGAVSIQISAGFAKFGPIGLLVGAIFNTGAAFIILGIDLWRKRPELRSAISWRRMREQARVHDKFPKFSSVEALCNVAAIQVPVLIIAAVALGPEPGYVLLAISVLQAPMALFGIAIGQVYFSHAPDEYRRGRLADFTVETMQLLVRSGVGPLIAGGMVAPFLFGMVFGPGWERAGVILAWMTPWFVMQFLASPISMALFVTGHQRRALALQIFNLASRVGAVALAWLVDVRYVTEAYAISGFLAYLVYYLVVMHTIGAPASGLLLSLRRSVRILGFWILAGIAVIALSRIVFPF